MKDLESFLKNVLGVDKVELIKIDKEALISNVADNYEGLVKQVNRNQFLNVINGMKDAVDNFNREGANENTIDNIEIAFANSNIVDDNDLALLNDEELKDYQQAITALKYTIVNMLSKSITLAEKAVVRRHKENVNNGAGKSPSKYDNMSKEELIELLKKKNK